MMRLLVLGILMGFPLLEGSVLYLLASGPNGHGAWVLTWLLFSFVAGVVLIKEARFSLVNRLATAVAHGHFSLGAIIDSFRTVLAGLLLIFPGVVSDLIALVLLLLPMREPAYQKSASRNARAHRPVAGGAIEGEFRREN